MNETLDNKEGSSEGIPGSDAELGPEAPDRSVQRPLLRLEGESWPRWAMRHAPLVLYGLLQGLALALRKRVARGASPYPFALTVAQPMSTTFAFSALALLTRRRGETATMGVPMSRYAAMGLLLSASNALVFSGARGGYVPGAVVVLVQQMVVPLSLAAAALTRTVRLRWTHFLGAAMVLAGVAACVAPEIHSRAGNARAGPFTGHAALVAASTAPLAGSIALMDAQFRGHPGLGVFTVWAWLNLFEFFAAFPLALAILPLQGVPLGDAPANLASGFACIFAGHETGSYAEAAGAQCGDIGWYFAAFIVVLVSAKGAQGALVRAGTAPLTFIAGALAVPVAEAVLTWRAIFGSGANTWHAGIIVGVLCVAVGTILYRWHQDKIHTPARRGQILASTNGSYTDSRAELTSLLDNATA